jgi:hypothetical protein
MTSRFELRSIDQWSDQLLQQAAVGGEASGSCLPLLGGASAGCFCLNVILYKINHLRSENVGCTSKR